MLMLERADAAGAKPTAVSADAEIHTHATADLDLLCSRTAANTTAELTRSAG